MNFRKTKAGIAICPFFIWTSEEREQHENSVSLTFCAHPGNKNDCEGNCSERSCPLTKGGDDNG